MRAVVAAALALVVDGVRVPRKASVNDSSVSFSSCGSKGRSAAADDDDEFGIAIVNGQPADECEWKWQVGLTSRQGRMPFCGGMLISADWALSAAHCMGGSFQVVAGDHKPRETSGKEQARRMQRSYKHPKYSSRTMDFDLALVKLDRPMNLNNCVGTVCLPKQGQDVRAGTNCWITGWGTLSSGGSQPNVLQEVQVKTMSNSDCKKTGYPSSEILNSMLCAQGRSGGGITDACQGDSGGPLVCKSGGAWTIFGATSWGYGCAASKYPGVWARVHEGLDWIKSTTR